MITRGGSRSSSGSGAEPVDERLCKFISAEVTHGILDATPVLFDTIKEGILKLMNERHKTFRAEIVVGQIGARAPSFREFKACVAPEFFGAKDPIASRQWITDMENAQ